MKAAVESGDAKELAEMIRQDPGFNVNIAADASGFTLLHYACLGDSCSAVIPLLLAHPDMDVNVKDRSGYTPFSYACGGRPSCVREMLKDSRAKVNESSKIGLTPLHRAARYGSVDVIKWWIASGREIDLGKPGDVDRTDAIGRAKKEGKSEVVTLLERFKSDAAKTRIEVKKELGINGQYSSIIPSYSCSYSRPLSFSVHGLLHFLTRHFFTFNVIVKNLFFLFSSLLSLNIRFPCVHPTKAHHGAVPRLCWWRTRRHRR